MDSLVPSTMPRHQSTGTTGETLALVPVETTRETLVWSTTTRGMPAWGTTTTTRENTMRQHK